MHKFSSALVLQLARKSFTRSRTRGSRRRPMGIETLETRLCFSAIRIVTWNTENGPDGAADIDVFRTVFSAIGNETVQGNTLPPSIVALQETDNTQRGGNSIAVVESILDSLYPQTDYAHFASQLDSGDDATGFVYDTGIFDLVSTSIVQATQGMTPFAHNITRGQFRPDGTSGASDFYIYTTHLKAGSSSDDAIRRTAEANAIRLDIDALGDGQDVLVMGDFNISSSNEGAYQNFLRSGAGQLFDPINSPGNWKNNSQFVGIHTQNPEINGDGGMDDRFDFQLATAEVFDNEGLQFIPGSYHAFGNNGTHQFNSDITTGTGASPTVLLALAKASDHLPVVVDYLIGDPPRPEGITIAETGSSTVIVEGGAGDSYSVVLNTVPTANVVITITADAQSRVNGSSSTTLTFTPSNALTPQFISLIAVNDDVNEGQHITTIVHSISSSDAFYSALSPVSFQSTVIDDDAPNVVISELMYDPATLETTSVGEWIEIANLGPGSVDISGWLIDDEDSTNWSPIPVGTPLLVAGGVAVIHSDLVTSAAFRTQWSVPASALVIAVTWGNLSNSPAPGNEVIELLDAAGNRQDAVDYDDVSPWPARNNASSIYLTDLTSDNNLGLNWKISVVGQQGARSPSGSTFSSNDIGSPGIVPSSDSVPPTIIDFKVAGSAWLEPFLNRVDPSKGRGYSLPGPNQLRNLSWDNVDKVIIEFSENVGDFTASNFTLSGISTPNYASQIQSVAYDASSYIATITLREAIKVDSLRISIADALTDLAGNRLDGEWSDAMTTKSGNGSAGGNFDFGFDVLPGDFLNSDSVTIFDIFGVSSRVFTDASMTGFDIFADVDGSGSVTIFDVFAVGRAVFTSLPTPPPQPVAPEAIALRSVGESVGDSRLEKLTARGQASQRMYQRLRSRRG